MGSSAYTAFSYRFHFLQHTARLLQKCCESPREPTKPNAREQLTTARPADPLTVSSSRLKHDQGKQEERLQPIWFRGLAELADIYDHAFTIDDIADNEYQVRTGGSIDYELQRIYGSIGPARKLQHKRGLASLVNGSRLSALADTGAGHNIMSALYVHERGFVIDTHAKSWFRLGNGRMVQSLGTVQVDYAFAGEVSHHNLNLICHVLKDSLYDLILGQPFLWVTETMTKFRHRFTECLFSVGRFFHFGFFGNGQERLRGTLADLYRTNAVPDTGAERNVIDLE